MCCEFLEQRKAAGQERARARDCPDNAATSKNSRIPWDRPERLAGRVGRPQQGPGPTGGTRLASEPFGLCITSNLKSKRY
jgi:hypothetical protein